MLYKGMPERLYDAPGIWNLKRCSNAECGVIWLDLMRLEAEIGKRTRDLLYTRAVNDSKTAA
jgi:hypothetical protein